MMKLINSFIVIYRTKYFIRGLNMNYIKLYLSTHLKYWWLYIILLVTLFYGSIFGMISVYLLAGIGIPENTAWIIGTSIGGLIFSSPLVYVNYKVAANYISSNNSRINIFLLTIFNHLVTYIISLAIFKISL